MISIRYFAKEVVIEHQGEGSGRPPPEIPEIPEMPLPDLGIPYNNSVVIVCKLIPECVTK